uniref:Uncharacterized protein n=1 Tax=Pelusios castaneus TaxID=367368 RepID=A0A8C8RWT7_9SAUR
MRKSLKFCFGPRRPRLWLFVKHRSFPCLHKQIPLEDLLGALRRAARVFCCLFLQLLLATFEGQLFSLIQPQLQVFDGLLHVLLHPLQVGTGVLLLLQLLRHHSRLPAREKNNSCLPEPANPLHPGTGLELRIHHPQMVALGLLHLLILLCKFPLKICLDLVKLQLGPQDLPLLVLQGGLGRKESSEERKKERKKG